jgi:hypothetical protein
MINLNREFYKNATVITSILLLYLLFFIYSYWNIEPAEDAVILFEYSKNFFHKNIITYSQHQYPIEGATDFLWMILIGLLKYITISEYTSSLLLNFLGLIYITYLFRGNYQKIIFALAIIATPFLYSALSGFSTLFFSAIFLACLNNVQSSIRLVYSLILLLCLIRPDGVIFGVGCILLRFYYFSKENNNRDIKIEITGLIIFLIVPGIIYFIWRAWYFTNLLPLPFYVKSGHPTNLWIFYKHSIFDVATVITPFLLTVLLFRDKFTAIKFLIIFIFAIFFYSSFVLEQNVGNRFMAPFFRGSIFISKFKKYNPAKYFNFYFLNFKHRYSI